MTSVSRSGNSQSLEGVTVKNANVFKPEEYRTFLKNATSVVYSLGMLLEGDYKAIAKGKIDVAKVMRLLKGRNPLEADPENPYGYDAIHRDGGVTLTHNSNCSNPRSYGSCKCRRTHFYLYLVGSPFSWRAFKIYRFQTVGAVRMKLTAVKRKRPLLKFKACDQYSFVLD